MKNFVLQPNYLKKGDTVGIFCPARFASLEDCQDAISLLDSWELKVKIGKTIGLKHHQFGGDDNERARDLQDMMNDNSLSAIWCAKGGYGTSRILDKLDFSSFLKHPKWIVGYSDVTALLSHLYTLGIPSIHATMPTRVKEVSSRGITSLKQALFGLSLEYSLPYEEEIVPIEAPLVGGNLSVLFSLLGSPSSVYPEDCVLFLEDLDEYLYHIDRMVLNLKRNLYLSKLKAIIVGGFTDIHDNNVPFGKSAREIILEHTQEYNYPVFFDFPAGHITNNCALYIGKSIRIKKEKNLAHFSFL